MGRVILVVGVGLVEKEKEMERERWRDGRSWATLANRKWKENSKEIEAQRCLGPD